MSNYFLNNDIPQAEAAGVGLGNTLSQALIQQPQIRAELAARLGSMMAQQRQAQAMGQYRQGLLQNRSQQNEVLDQLKLMALNNLQQRWQNQDTTANRGLDIKQQLADRPEFGSDNRTATFQPPQPGQGGQGLPQQGQWNVTPGTNNPSMNLNQTIGALAKLIPLNAGLANSTNSAVSGMTNATSPLIQGLQQQLPQQFRGGLQTPQMPQVNPTQYPQGMLPGAGQMQMPPQQPQMGMPPQQQMQQPQQPQQFTPGMKVMQNGVMYQFDGTNWNPAQQ